MWAIESIKSSRGCDSPASRVSSRDALNVGGKDLERDTAIELAVVRAIDFAHSTSAEGGNDRVRPDAHTWAEQHRRRRRIAPRRDIL
jgi:hypothetical protein